MFCLKPDSSKSRHGGKDENIGSILEVISGSTYGRVEKYKEERKKGSAGCLKEQVAIMGKGSSVPLGTSVRPRNTCFCVVPPERQVSLCIHIPFPVHD